MIGSGIEVVTEDGNPFKTGPLPACFFSSFYFWEGGGLHRILNWRDE